MKKMKAVLIKWIDSTSFHTGWSRDKKYKPVEITTIGWVIKKTWKKIKRFYWKQQLSRLETDMMIFAISYNYYIEEKGRLQTIIAELS